MQTLVDNLENILIFPLALILVYETILFVFGILLKNNSIADVGWGLGFVIVAWFSYFTQSPQTNLDLLVNVLVSIWGIRLFLHIALRNFGKPEDFRYQNMRANWKKFFLLKSFLIVFFLQGFLMYIISLPVIFVNVFSENTEFSYFTWAGYAIFSTGLLFETIADWQLSKFVNLKKKGYLEKDAIITNGLWKYSRHPNYFGEALLWWGIYFIAIEIPFAWLTLLGPLTINILVRYVSGVPLLERKYMKNPNFREYANKTSVFIPLPPKK
ncbi:MAG: hypothetical protein KatS3mg085_615 [Candidatus Dojkabacteria bacterium]|nr:MAG: hypothetical protein KatS3mg085_615 [Candidatus Dojkabacteria bacterium]